MLSRRLLALSVLAVLAAAGVAPSGAVFTAGSANPANRLTAAADWLEPSVTADRTVDNAAFDIDTRPPALLTAATTREPAPTTTPATGVDDRDPDDRQNPAAVAPDEPVQVRGTTTRSATAASPTHVQPVRDQSSAGLKR